MIKVFCSKTTFGEICTLAVSILKTHQAFITNLSKVFFDLWFKGI